MFYTIGMLRELIKIYPDNTPILVEGTPGLFLLDEDGRYINLCSLDGGADTYPESDIESPAMVRVDYMDF